MGAGEALGRHDKQIQKWVKALLKKAAEDSEEHIYIHVCMYVCMHVTVQFSKHPGIICFGSFIIF